MKSGLTGIQQAVYELLTADTTLMAMVRKVCDYSPPFKDFPVLVIGEERGNQYDTKTEGGEEVNLELHVFSKQGGWKETRQIMDRVIRVMTDSAISIDSSYSYRAIGAARVTTSLTYGDDNTRHGVVSLNIKTEEVK